MNPCGLKVSITKESVLISAVNISESSDVEGFGTSIYALRCWFLPSSTGTTCPSAREALLWAASSWRLQAGAEKGPGCSVPWFRMCSGCAHSLVAFPHSWGIARQMQSLQTQRRICSWFHTSVCNYFLAIRFTIMALHLRSYCSCGENWWMYLSLPLLRNSRPQRHRQTLLSPRLSCHLSQRSSLLRWLRSTLYAFL